MIYEKTKPWRLRKQFIWVTTFSGFWFNMETREWTTDPDWSRGGWSNCATCKTVRSFRRMLRKNPQLRGKAILVSRFVGYNVRG